MCDDAKQRFSVRLCVVLRIKPRASQTLNMYHTTGLHPRAQVSAFRSQSPFHTFERSVWVILGMETENFYRQLICFLNSNLLHVIDNLTDILLFVLSLGPTVSQISLEFAVWPRLALKLKISLPLPPECCGNRHVQHIWLHNSFIKHEFSSKKQEEYRWCAFLHL